MANTNTYELKQSLLRSLSIMCAMGAVALFISGGIIYHRDHTALTTHEQNSCKVISSNYYQSTCRGSRASTYVCFRPFWVVSYNVFQDGTEKRIDAGIEHHGLRTTEQAENRLLQYLVSVFKEQIYLL